MPRPLHRNFDLAPWNFDAISPNVSPIRLPNLMHKQKVTRVLVVPIVLVDVLWLSACGHLPLRCNDALKLVVRAACRLWRSIDERLREPVEAVKNLIINVMVGP